MRAPGASEGAAGGMGGGMGGGIADDDLGPKPLPNSGAGPSMPPPKMYCLYARLPPLEAMAASISACVLKL